MLKLDPCPSHSWWWDSHNSPKHSKWLQSNLRELDEKVKEMLTVIQEDADSFAQRAEMYYQKRPKLVNLVEEFYRAYRSLAERYDHLTGEIRQNIPRALQLQYGLSCDSPRPNNGSSRHTHSSPLRKSSNHVLQSLKRTPTHLPSSDDDAQCITPDKLVFKKCSFNGAAEAWSSSPSPGMGKETIINPCDSNGERKALDNSRGHSNEKGDENLPSTSSSDDGISSSSDSEADNSTLLDRLRKEMETLAQEKKQLSETHQEALQRNSILLDEMKFLQNELALSRKEVQSLQSRLDDVVTSRKEVHSLEGTSDGRLIWSNDNNNNKKSPELFFQQHANTEGRSNREAHDVQEVLPILEEEYDYSAGEEEPLPGCHEIEATDRKDGDSNVPGGCQESFGLCEPDVVAQIIRNLQNQVASLLLENENQKLALAERGEEKKEAIRQLCFAMDVLKSKNKRLQEVIRELSKKKQHAAGPRSGGAGEVATVAFDWGKLFRGEWRRCRTVQPLTVAL